MVPALIVATWVSIPALVVCCACAQAVVASSGPSARRQRS
jgi:hypothetical protein